MAMLTTTEVVVALVTSLFAGGFMSNLLMTFVGTRKRKTDEAEALSKISAEIRQEVRQDNQELRERIDRLADALISLTDMLDELFPKIATNLHPEERDALRAKINNAKRFS